MRSKYADYFNHDEDAPEYDHDVLNEADPIRAGYDALLSWIASRVQQAPSILDLGAGTGNLTQRLPHHAAVTCVDISSEMLSRARSKLADREEIRYVEADLLEFFESSPEPFDAVVSSYAIHHLTAEEKTALFQEIRGALRPTGQAVFGDLGFANPGAWDAYRSACLDQGRKQLVEDIEDEFFWDIERAVRDLETLGFSVETRRFSELSWGIGAVLQP